MFDNIGGKIKTLAKVLCWIGIVASVIGGIIMIVGTARSSNPGLGILLSLLYMALGCLISWVGSFFAYGFGELIENTEAIRRNTNSGT